MVVRKEKKKTKFGGAGNKGRHGSKSKTPRTPSKIKHRPSKGSQVLAQKLKLWEEQGHDRAAYRFGQPGNHAISPLEAIGGLTEREIQDLSHFDLASWQRARPASTNWAAQKAEFGKVRRDKKTGKSYIKKKIKSGKNMGKFRRVYLRGAKFGYPSDPNPKVGQLWQGPNFRAVIVRGPSGNLRLTYPADKTNVYYQRAVPRTVDRGRRLAYWALPKKEFLIDFDLIKRRRKREEEPHKGLKAHRRGHRDGPHGWEPDDDGMDMSFGKKKTKFGGVSKKALEGEEARIKKSEENKYTRTYGATPWRGERVIKGWGELVRQSEKDSQLSAMQADNWANMRKSLHSAGGIKKLSKDNPQLAKEWQIIFKMRNNKKGLGVNLTPKWYDDEVRALVVAHFDREEPRNTTERDLISLKEDLIKQQETLRGLKKEHDMLERTDESLDRIADNLVEQAKIERKIHRLKYTIKNIDKKIRSALTIKAFDKGFKKEVNLDTVAGLLKKHGGMPSLNFGKKKKPLSGKRLKAMAKKHGIRLTTGKVGHRKKKSEKTLRKQIRNAEKKKRK